MSKQECHVHTHQGNHLIPLTFFFFFKKLFLFFIEFQYMLFAYDNCDIYYLIKSMIDFLCSLELNLKYLFQLLEILSVKLNKI